MGLRPLAALRTRLRRRIHFRSHRAVCLRPRTWRVRPCFRATGVGVIGESSGTSGIGVVGKDLSGGGLGFYSQGHAAQNRTGGGWVKALMYVNTEDAPYNIVNCFNSTLMGAAATAPPCGFTLTELGPGNFTIDVGFEVDDRFVSATVNGNPSAPSVLVAPNNHTLNIIWYDLFAGGIRGEYYWVAIY